jgi:hypothetical protein
MHSHRQILLINKTIFMAGALSLCHSTYWNFKDVCFTALHYIGKLAMYGMPCLAFFIVQSLHSVDKKTLQYNTHLTNPTPINSITHILHTVAVPKLCKNVNQVIHNFLPLLPLRSCENFLNLILQMSLLCCAAIVT